MGTTIGKAVLVHGAIGELAPIVAMSLLLSARSPWLSFGVLMFFVSPPSSPSQSPRASC